MLSELIEKLIDAKIKLERINHLYSPGAAKEAIEELIEEKKDLKQKIDSQRFHL